MTRELAAHGIRCAEAAYPPALVLPEHAHEKPCITVVLEGSFEESLAGTDGVPCEASALVLRPAGEAHRNRIGRHGVRNLELEFDPSWLGGEPATGALRRPCVLRHPVLADLVRVIRAELSVRDSAWALVCEGAALELLGRALRIGGASGRTGALASRPPRWLERVRDRLHAGFRDDTRWADLAVEAGVHPVHLARAFRRHFGASPGGYLRGLRLQWAAEALVRDLEKAITEIAVEAGFYDHSHFARAFKAANGMTPSQFRATRDR